MAVQVYRCELVMQDYLFFATTERGKIAETGAFIHNYALTYALGWATSAYRNETQKPNYREELAAVDKRYVTPARFVRGSYLLNQYNTMSENYHLSKGQSIGYPDWGFIKCFRPGATFCFYVISAKEIEFPAFIRLGKFMAKARLQISPAAEVKQSSRSSLHTKIETSNNKLLLNWEDLLPTSRPIIYDILGNSLPTRLIDNPVFAEVVGPYLLASFAAANNKQTLEVELPLQMGYLGVNPCLNWSNLS